MKFKSCAGVEILCSGQLRVFGSCRELRFYPKDIVSVATAQVPEGRIGLVARNGTKILLRKCKPEKVLGFARVLAATGFCSEADVSNIELKEEKDPEQEEAQASQASAWGETFSREKFADGGRQGDWMCPKCKALRWASKSECFKCGSRKPSSEASQSQQLP